MGLHPGGTAVPDRGALGTVTHHRSGRAVPSSRQGGGAPSYSRPSAILISSDLTDESAPRRDCGAGSGRAWRDQISSLGKGRSFEQAGESECHRIQDPARFPFLPIPPMSLRPVRACGCGRGTRLARSDILARDDRSFEPAKGGVGAGGYSSEGRSLDRPIRPEAHRLSKTSAPGSFAKIDATWTKTRARCDQAAADRWALARISAIWTLFRAAPLRILSETIHRFNPRGWVISSRMRPTKTSSLPADSIAAVG